jgi:hypothetical protein
MNMLMCVCVYVCVCLKVNVLYHVLDTIKTYMLTSQIWRSVYLFMTFSDVQSFTFNISLVIRFMNVISQRF